MASDSGYDGERGGDDAAAARAGHWLAGSQWSETLRMERRKRGWGARRRRLPTDRGPGAASGGGDGGGDGNGAGGGARAGRGPGLAGSTGLKRLGRSRRRQQDSRGEGRAGPWRGACWRGGGRHERGMPSVPSVPSVQSVGVAFR